MSPEILMDHSAVTFKVKESNTFVPLALLCPSGVTMVLQNIRDH